jgi:hypothetical protein
MGTAGMTHHTKAEIVVVVGVGALLLYLILRRPTETKEGYVGQALPVGSTDGSVPVWTGDSADLAPLAPIDGSTFNLGGYGSTGFGPATSRGNGACGCNTCDLSGGFGLTFGSQRDLEAYLTAQGGYIPPGASIGDFY